MSASLVGSEMCIRDRLRADLAIPGSAVLHSAILAEAALGLTDPEYRAMAKTRLAMPVISAGLTRARCRSAL
eukprot:1333548-Alexandrium_andersonii.AAC.1